MRELHPSDTIRFPQVILAEDFASTLPLEHTSVHAQVNGLVASVILTQRFGNPLSEPAELDYLFPLPENAAVTGFEMRIGTRRIDGEVQEQAAAQAAYADARTQGKRAGLFEQRRPNLFVVRLANVLPGETIQAIFHYQQRLSFADDSYEFIFPMGLTPRYESPEHPEEGQGVNAPVARGGESVGLVEIRVAVDAGLPVGEPTSPSHPIETEQIDRRRFQVHLAGEHIPDHDFILRYPLMDQNVQGAGWTSGTDQEQFFLATIMPPKMEGEVSVPQREFIFVLDRSGSMTGEPIAQARNALRACLRVLNPGDSFRILLFDNVLEWYQPTPVAINQEQLDRADAYLSQVQGRGGTEIVRALEEVLALEPDPLRTRYIVFLTDGAVSAEARALEKIRARIGAVRLFSFGIGPSVNCALLSRMASLGRGRAAFMQLDEDIEGAIIQFQDSVSFPLLTDLSLEWHNGKAWDIYPERLPDLYYGQPLEICGRMRTTNSAPLRLVVHGRRHGEAVQIDLKLPSPVHQDEAVDRIWARARVDYLLEQQELEAGRSDRIRIEIINLALTYNLATPYTSFIAIDHDTVQGGGKPLLIHVAQPLPQGLNPSAFDPTISGSRQISMPPSMPVAQMSMMLASRLPGTAEDFKVGDPINMAAPGKMVEPRLYQSGIPGRRESGLRWLARTQKINGSWEDDVEWTAAALLAFVRSGHTTRSGSFRQVLRRAVHWLSKHSGSGFAGFVCALALEELAAITEDAQEQAAAREARKLLPEPVNALEQAASGVLVQLPESARSLDDLRLAAVMRKALPLSEKLFQGEWGELAQVWAAALIQS